MRTLTSCSLISASIINVLATLGTVSGMYIPTFHSYQLMDISMINSFLFVTLQKEVVEYAGVVHQCYDFKMSNN